jgi:hypothetical protein
MIHIKNIDILNNRLINNKKIDIINYKMLKNDSCIYNDNLNKNCIDNEDKDIKIL